MTVTIKKPKALINAIRKYDLQLIGIDSGAGFAERENEIYLYFAKRGSGQRGGRYRNYRIAKTTTGDFGKIRTYIRPHEDLPNSELLYLKFMQAKTNTEKKEG